MTDNHCELARDLLQELLWTYGPCGQEDAVRDICRRELEPAVDELWVDEAANLVGLIRGSATDESARATRVMAHMDELSMIVKRVEQDATLHLTPLGTMYPANFGLGPVAVLGDQQMLIGVLTLGSEHTTKESERIWETKPDQGDKSLDWTHVYVFTGRTLDELTAAGVGPGTRVCIDRSKRTLLDVGDYLGCYFHGRPRVGDCAAAGGTPTARARAETRNRRLFGVHDQRGDRRRGRLIRQPHAAWGFDAGAGGRADRAGVHHHRQWRTDRRLQRCGMRL